jgi:LCP family protein required for cell wall assembly
MPRDDFDSRQDQSRDTEQRGSRRARHRPQPSGDGLAAALRRPTARLAGPALIAVRVIAALMSLAVLLGSFYAWSTYRSFVSNVTHVDAIVPRPSTTPGGAAPASQKTGVEQNILLVGDDHRPPGATAAELAQLSTTQDGGSVNTDTIMVLHIPADGSKATGISLPRDSWVDIPGFGMNKLNSAFEFGSENGGGDTGGARLLIATIQNITGLTIDHFVRVSMLGFYDIAQTLGPIKVCLNEPAKDPYSGTDLPAGVSYLSAKQALSFVRQRHGLPRGDLDREVRQQYFLSQAFQKVASAGTLLNPFKLQSLLKAVSGALETDPGLNLLTFAQQFQDLAAGNLTFATIPINGTPTIDVSGSQLSIVSINLSAVKAFVSAIVGPPSAYAAAKALTPSAVTVTVLNGSGVNGAATQDSAALDQFGFHTAAPGSAPSSTTTTIEYPTGMEAQAKTLAGYVPGASVTASSSVGGVTLILGSDGGHVSNPETAQPAGTASPAATPSSPARSYSATDCIN